MEVLGHREGGLAFSESATQASSLGRASAEAKEAQAALEERNSSINVVVTGSTNNSKIIVIIIVIVSHSIKCSIADALSRSTCRSVLGRGA